jgi:hypothetical protein
VPAGTHNPIKSPPLTLMLALNVFRPAASDLGPAEATTVYSFGVPDGRKTTSASWPPLPPCALHEVIVQFPAGIVYEVPPETPVWATTKSPGVVQAVSAPTCPRVIVSAPASPAKTAAPTSAPATAHDRLSRTRRP